MVQKLTIVPPLRVMESVTFSIEASQRLTGGADE